MNDDVKLPKADYVYTEVTPIGEEPQPQFCIQLRGPDDQVWRIYEDGRFEGFPEGTRSHTYPSPTFNMARALAFGPEIPAIDETNKRAFQKGCLLAEMRVRSLRESLNQFYGRSSRRPKNVIPGEPDSEMVITIRRTFPDGREILTCIESGVADHAYCEAPGKRLGVQMRACTRPLTEVERLLQDQETIFPDAMIDDYVAPEE